VPPNAAVPSPLPLHSCSSQAQPHLHRHPESSAFLQATQDRKRKRTQHSHSLQFLGLHQCRSHSAVPLQPWGSITAEEGAGGGVAARCAAAHSMHA